MTPFHKPLLRYFLLWMVGLTAVFAGIVFIGTNQGEVNAEVGGLLLQMASVLPFIWLLWQQMSNRIDVRRFFYASIKPFRWFHLVLIVPFMALFSFGIDSLFTYGLSWFAPDYVEELLQAEIIIPEMGMFFNVFTVILAAIVAPIMEEFVFRGLILQRLTVKTNVTAAILISSLGFGLLHAESWIGATVFGIIMAILYLNTKNLLVPIAVHIANNLVAVSQEFTHPEGGTSLETFRSDVWFFVSVLAVTPALFYYLRKYWPKKDESRLPYALTGDLVRG